MCLRLKVLRQGAGWGVGGRRWRPSSQRGTQGRHTCLPCGPRGATRWTFLLSAPSPPRRLPSGSWNVSLRRKGKARVCCLPAQRSWHCTPVGRLDLGEGPTLILYICVAPRFFFKELPGCRRHWPLSCVLAVKALELLSLGCRF